MQIHDYHDVPSVKELRSQVWAQALLNCSGYVIIQAIDDEAANEIISRLGQCEPLPASVTVTVRWYDRRGLWDMGHASRCQDQVTIPGGGQEP